MTETMHPTIGVLKRSASVHDISVDDHGKRHGIDLLFSARKDDNFLPRNSPKPYMKVKVGSPSNDLIVIA